MKLYSYRNQKLELMKHDDNYTNNKNNNLVEPSNPPTPPTKVISHHTSESPVVEAVKTANKKEPETITISKADFDKLVIELNNLRLKNMDLKARLDGISGALIQIQATVHNTKNSI